MLITIDADKERTVLEEAIKRIGSWFDVFGHNITTGQDDKEFVYESQWTESESTQFSSLNKPELQINKIHPAIRTITGNQERMDPQIKIQERDVVSSSDEQELIANQKKIDLLENLVRTISYDSHASDAYSAAFESALTSGFGVLWVDTDYADERSFDQRPFITHKSFEMAFFDVAATDPIKSDGDFCGYYEQMSKKDFEREYPDVSFADASFPTFQTQSNFLWYNKDHVSIVYYYTKEYKKRTLFKLADNTTMFEDEYKERQKEIEEAHVELNQELGVSDIDENILAEVVDKRVVDDYKIMGYKMIAHKVLDTFEWPSKKLPGVFVDGDSYISKGIQRTQSFVYHARDVQRFLNYCAVEIADGLQKGRRETWLATPDMAKGFENQWKMPSNVQGALFYNAQRDGSKPIPVPPSEVPHSLANTYQSLTIDLQQVMGVYDANMGAPDKLAVSGKAIANRARQGSMAPSKFENNLKRGMQGVGEIVLSLVPRLYDTTRTIVLTKADGDQTQESINTPTDDNKIHNDLTKGSFNIEVTVGPNYELQKQEYLQMLIGLVGSQPQVFPLVADLIADNIDIGNRQQLVERFKELVPQPIKDKEAGRVPAPPPPAPPNPEVQLEQQKQRQEAEDLKFKYKELGVNSRIKQEELRLDAIKLKSNVYTNQQKDRLDHRKVGAEETRTAVDYQTNLDNLIADLAKESKSER